MRKFFSPNSAITQLGIEITPHQMHGLLLTKYKQELIVNQSASLPWNSQKSYADNLLVLTSHFTDKKLDVIIGINYQKIISKTLNFEASLSEKEILEHLDQHASSYFGYASDKIYFDFKKCGLTSENDKFSYQVVAAQRVPLEPLIRACKGLGLKIRAIDVDVFAIVRAVLLSAEYNDSLTMAVILTSTEQILFCVIKSRQIYFVKIIDPEFNIDEIIEKTLENYHLIHYHHPIQKIIIIASDESIKELILDRLRRTSIPLSQFNWPLLPSLTYLCALGLAAWGIADGY